MFEWVRNSRIRRWMLLVAYSALLVVVLAVMLVVSVGFFHSKELLSDKLAEVADVIAGGTAVLAVIAGLVAIQAYAAATGLPKLEIQVWFETSEKNRPIFRIRDIGNGLFETIPLSQTRALISLRNRSHYGARNVVVTIKLESIAADANDILSATGTAADEWKTFSFPDAAFGERELVVQWQSSPDVIFHGGAYRRLPDLDLGLLRYSSSWPPPEMVAELFADGGYRRCVRFTIGFVDEGAPVAHIRDRKVREWLLSSSHPKCFRISCFLSGRVPVTLHNLLKVLRSVAAMLHQSADLGTECKGGGGTASVGVTRWAVRVVCGSGGRRRRQADTYLR